MNTDCRKAPMCDVCEVQGGHLIGCPSLRGEKRVQADDQPAPLVERISRAVNEEHHYPAFVNLSTFRTLLKEVLETVRRHREEPVDTDRALLVLISRR